MCYYGFAGIFQTKATFLQALPDKAPLTANQKAKKRGVVWEGAPETPGGEIVSNEMKEAMSKMAELIRNAPEEKQRDIGNFLAGCVAGLEIAVGGGKKKEEA